MNSELGGEKFDGVEWCVEFVCQHFKDGWYGLCIDVMSMFHSTKKEYISVRENTDRDLSERNRYAGKVLWAALRTHQYMKGLMSMAFSQSVDYQESVMLHVVENCMSLSKYDALKDRAADYDSRLNRLKQLAKIKNGRKKEGE